MAKILYAVIALKRTEVDAVIAELKTQRMQGIADWLDKRKDNLYGRRSEDWKPFKGVTVDELLNASSDDYQSSTSLIDAIKPDLSNTYILNRSKIEIYFIDIFALFSPRYKALAGKLDLYMAEGGRKCCLVMPYGLSDDSGFIMTAYSSVWSAVVNAYLEGSLHPIVLRAEDLTHLRNYILTLPRLEDSPAPDNIRQMEQRYGQAAHKPQLG
jgi:hypothetical protein